MKNLLIILLFSLAACHSEPPTFNPQKAQKIYAQQLKDIINIYHNAGASERDTMNLLNYYGVEEQKKIPFVRNDTAKDFAMLNYFGEYIIYISVAEFNTEKSAEYRQNFLTIGSTNIAHTPISSKYKLRPISLLYNPKYDSYYAWLPFEFGAYALNLDSTKYTSDYKLLHQLEAEAYYGKNYISEWTHHSNRIYNIYTLNTTNNFHTISLKNTPHYNLLKDIISELEQPESVDSMLTLLQNQCNYASSGITLTHCVRFVDSSANELYVFRDTCKITTFPSLTTLNIYEKLNTQELYNLKLLYPDLSRSKIPEIAAYAEQTKPSFIYFKRSFISYSLNVEPYYYFIFYYIDFVPSGRPKLKDMQVVFPRRFGLSR